MIVLLIISTIIFSTMWTAVYKLHYKNFISVRCAVFECDAAFVNWLLDCSFFLLKISFYFNTVGNMRFEMKFTVKKTTTKMSNV